ncbi:hypothetical protein D9C73_012638 [Collichthys lucidus]|uniref:Uncharacterized protein n=1 Tax=Collichthys lucidus TaxID=240159 RepID=A0A4U5UTM8_COLLU|nr:hypothetical protein D9C73_012638 [Collichthys lucidus]
MTQCPSLSQPYCQHRATTPHVRGRRRDTGPTGLTVLRRTVLPGGGSSQWDFGQQEHSGHLYDAFIQRSADNIVQLLQHLAFHC